MLVSCVPLTAAAASGESFRHLLPYALIAAAVVVALQVGIAWVFRGAPASRTRWNLWDMLVYWGTIGSVALLGVTSLVAVLRDGALGGSPLFIHMVGAGAFTAALPVIAVSWAHANRLPLRTATGRTAPPKFFGISKPMFWLILVGGLVVTLTMLVSMLPIFGSDGLLTLLDVHRWAGLIVVAAAAVHLASVTLSRFGLR